MPGFKSFIRVVVEDETDARKRLDEGCYYLERLRHVVRNIEEWYVDLSASQEGKELHKPKPATWINVEDSCFPSAYTFPDLSLAMALTFYDAIRIRVIGMVGDLHGTLQQTIADSSSLRLSAAHRARFDEVWNVLYSTRVYESAARICQSVEYFFEEDKSLVGPNAVIFPFHIAWTAFCVLEKRREQSHLSSSDNNDFAAEIAWCEIASKRYEATNLPSLESLDIGKSEKQDLRL